MGVIIYKPVKSAMQSGRGREKRWVLEHQSAIDRKPDPLMGWWGSGNTEAQVRLTFDTLEEAVAYATRKGLDYVVQPEQRRTLKLQSYADNFR